MIICSVLNCAFDVGGSDSYLALIVILLHLSSVTRLGNLLDFGQSFKAFGNNYFAQISYILRQFL